MKFDLVIGNPPYQKADGGAAASAKPIYQEFVNIAKDISTKYVSMIMPARWYTGGKGLDEFRLTMLSDKHIKLLYDYQRPDEVFPDTNNRGGLCFIVRDKGFDNTAILPKVISNRGGQDIVSQSRSIKTDGLDMFIRHQEAISILEKVTGATSFVPLSRHMSKRKPFGVESNIIKTPNWHLEKQANDVSCIGKGLSRGFIPYSLVTNNTEAIELWKVLVPRANNIGTELHDDNLNSEICPPQSICTEAYLFIGTGLQMDEKQATNTAFYMRTRFARFMHSLAKTSHDATSKTYRFVPLQDFTDQSDIDWTKSVDEIDKQLYAKYNLSKEEGDFIESKIKVMK